MKKSMFFICSKKRSVFLAISYLVFIAGCSSPTADELEVGVTDSKVSPVDQHPEQGGQVGNSENPQPDTLPSDSGITTGLHVDHHEDAQNEASGSGLQGTQSVKTGLCAQEWFRLEMWVDYLQWVPAYALYNAFADVRHKINCSKSPSFMLRKLSNLLQDANGRGVDFMVDRKAPFYTELRKLGDVSNIESDLNLAVDLILANRVVKKSVQNKRLKDVQKNARKILDLEGKNRAKTQIIRGKDHTAWKIIARGSLEALREFLQQKEHPEIRANSDTVQRLIKTLNQEEKSVKAVLKFLMTGSVKKEICGHGFHQAIANALFANNDDFAEKLVNVNAKKDELSQYRALLFLLNTGVNENLLPRMVPTIKKWIH